MSARRCWRILERLAARAVVIGDGGYSYALEKRGYVKAEQWTPECVVESPDAVRQLHREFVRAGADVIQAFTFSMQDKPVNIDGTLLTWDQINDAACVIAKEVAQERGSMVAGSLCQTGEAYSSGQPKQDIQDKFSAQVNVFVRNGVDLLIAEFFSYVEEAEWCVEVMRASGFPIAVTMAINKNGDLSGVSPGDCAVRLVQAGADMVGVNCRFDPFASLATMKLMKEALRKKGLNPHLIVQPSGYWTPADDPIGLPSLPECPYALEIKMITRWDSQRFARAAYDMGIRYIGGCCGFEPYHIRALAEELSPERGGSLPVASAKHSLWGTDLRFHIDENVRHKGNRKYWETLKPSPAPRPSDDLHPSNKET